MLLKSRMRGESNEKNNIDIDYLYSDGNSSCSSRTTARKPGSSKS